MSLLIHYNLLTDAPAPLVVLEASTDGTEELDLQLAQVRNSHLIQFYYRKQYLHIQTSHYSDEKHFFF